MQMRWLPIVGIAIALVLFAINGCSEGTLEEQAQQVIAGGGDNPEVRVAAISPTPAGVLEKLDVLIEPGEGGFRVNISANEDISDVKDIFLEIHYDANVNQAH